MSSQSSSSNELYPYSTSAPTLPLALDVSESADSQLSPHPRTERERGGDGVHDRGEENIVRWLSREMIVSLFDEVTESMCLCPPPETNFQGGLDDAAECKALCGCDHDGSAGIGKRAGKRCAEAMVQDMSSDRW